MTSVHQDPELLEPTGLIFDIAQRLASCSVLIQTAGFENNLGRRLGNDVGWALGFANPSLLTRCVEQLDRALKRTSAGGVVSSHPVVRALSDVRDAAENWKKLMESVHEDEDEDGE